MSSPRILVVSRIEEDQVILEDFFERAPFPKPDFVLNKFVPADKYDFVIFNCQNRPIANQEVLLSLPEEQRQFIHLLSEYLDRTNKYFVFFGGFYYNLNYDRCQAANSKFSLYARLREMIDFIGNFKQ